MLDLHKFIANYYNRVGMFQSFNPNIWTNFLKHEHLKVVSNNHRITIRNKTRNYKNIISLCESALRCNINTDFYSAKKLDSFLLCSVTKTIYVRFSNKIAQKIDINNINLAKKYYRLFYTYNYRYDSNKYNKKYSDKQSVKFSAELTKRIAWPIYKLPITIQNPYL